MLLLVAGTGSVGIVAFDIVADVVVVVVVANVVCSQGRPLYTHLSVVVVVVVVEGSHSVLLPL